MHTETLVEMHTEKEAWKGLEQQVIFGTVIIVSTILYVNVCIFPYIFLDAFFILILYDKNNL